MFIILAMLIACAYNRGITKKSLMGHGENVFKYDNDYYQNSLYVSRVYWDANFKKSLKDVNPHHLQFQDGNLKDYTKMEQLGRGAFSQVYLGKSADGTDVVMKVLKPIKPIAINREIQVLQAINGTIHTPLLMDAIRSQNRKQNATLIYKYIECVNLLSLFGQLSLHEIKGYMYQLLEALDAIHQKGVMHRDVKMANMIIHNGTLTLIDWGLGEFYHPKKNYNTRVGTRYYKAPELLVNNTLYDYSIDMWAFGCTLASLIFNRQPLFKGKDNIEQLEKIVKILGNEDLEKYIQKYDIRYKVEAKHRKKSLAVFLNDSNLHLVTNLGLDLLEKLLIYDHRERLTAAEAMQHPFFQDFN